MFVYGRNEKRYTQRLGFFRSTALLDFVCVKSIQKGGNTYRSEKKRRIVKIVGKLFV